MAQRWRDVADDITNNKQTEITFEDYARFVESKARALNHPIFGNITNHLNSKGKDPKNHRPRKGECFGIQGDVPNYGVRYSNKNSPAGADLAKPVSKCHLCSGDHWLTHSREFKKRYVEQRLTFMRKKDLCKNCFLPGHTIRSCPKNSYCKITLIIIQSTRHSCIQRYQIETLGAPLLMKTTTPKATEDRLKSTMAMQITTT